MIFAFTFMHLADAFSQSDLHCTESVHAFSGNQTHDLGVANAMQCRFVSIKSYSRFCIFILSPFVFQREETGRRHSVSVC